MYVLSPQLKVINSCLFQGDSTLHPNDVSEAIHVHQIHDNVPLAVVVCYHAFLRTTASKL
jgi:hypothetical protein